MLNVQKYVRMATRYLYRCPDASGIRPCPQVSSWLPKGIWQDGISSYWALDWWCTASIGSWTVVAIRVSGPKRPIENLRSRYSILFLQLSFLNRRCRHHFEPSSFHTFAFQPVFPIHGYMHILRINFINLRIIGGLTNKLKVLTFNKASGHGGFLFVNLRSQL